MEPSFVVTENWLTKKPQNSSGLVTLLIAFLLFGMGYLALVEAFGLNVWMPASGLHVFQGREYWRLWTALFIHADAGHLFSNAFLFFPFAYLLSSYYGYVLFPMTGLLIGGLINFYVLKSMPGHVSLIGISGVVYWLAATWLTLFVLIDSRKSLRRRIGIALVASFVLLFPETYKQEVSYYSHFLGYVFGVFSGAIFFVWKRREILAAEIKELVPQDEEIS